MGEAVSDSVVVQADAAAVWDVIADFDAYPEWNDEIVEAQTLEVGEDGWGTRAWFRIDAGVLQAEVVLAYAYTDWSLRWWLEEGDKVRRNDGTYELDPREDGTTEVRYELEIEPRVRVPAVLRRQAARRIVARALEGMRHQAERAGG